MFNFYDDHPEYVAPDRNLLNVYNPGSQMIPAFTAIRISGTTTLNGGSVLIFNVVSAHEDALSWGIAAENILPKSFGNMVVSGVIQAYVSGIGNYATPGADGKLVAGSSGKALILYKGDEKTPGIVQLGYTSGTKKDEYTGAFKLRHIEDRTFELCYGYYVDKPNHNYYNIAGKTDLPGVPSVPKQNIILPENLSSASVYLHAIYENGKYRVEVDFDDWKGFETVSIGSISADGSVTQSYKQDSTLYFGRQWYL